MVNTTKERYSAMMNVLNEKVLEGQIKIDDLNGPFDCDSERVFGVDISRYSTLERYDILDIDQADDFVSELSIAKRYVKMLNSLELKIDWLAEEDWNDRSKAEVWLKDMCDALNGMHLLTVKELLKY